VFSRGALLDTRCLNETMKASTNIETTYEAMFSLQWNSKGHGISLCLA